MSQRPPTSRPASRSPPDAQSVILPPVRPRDEALQVEGEDSRRPVEMEDRGRHIPSPQMPRPGQTTPSGDSWRAAPLRDLGVHSILNPTEPDRPGASDRGVSGSVPASPLSVSNLAHSASNPPQGATYTFPNQQTGSGQASAPENIGGTLPRVRKILTPRSPARTVSSGTRGGRIDAQRSPFLPSRGRSYTAETGHGSDIPPMPTQHANYPAREYGFPGTISTPGGDRRTSDGTMQAPGRTAPVERASPSISASSLDPSSSQTSPASFPHQKGQQTPSTTASYYPGSTFGSAIQQGGGIQFQGAAAAPEGPYSAQPPPQAQGFSSLLSSSAGSSRQTSASDPIQVITMITSEGEFTVPVDMHQASRLADEKRARNAGASARFRQRRKEKEKEASSNIEKLNQQTRELERRVRELEHEKDFYRTERDRYRDVVYRTPELRHLAMQAPPSPGGMRAPSFQTLAPQPQQQLGGPSPQLGFQPMAGSGNSSQERAPRRRRTDAQGEFASVSYSLPSASTLPPVQPPTYAQGQARSPPNLPPLRIDESPRTTTGSMTPTVRTPLTEAPQPPYNPYARGPYERGWPGDGGRR